MSRRLLAFAVAFGLLGAGGSEVAGNKIDFMRDGGGVPPTDFAFRRTGRGSNGDWAVVRDATASTGLAIEQSSRDATENRYPLAIYKPASLKNVEIGASFKLIAGAAQSAGLAFRLMDTGNYYVVAANALEGRVDLYRFGDGERERIAGTEADVVRDRWQSLRVVVEGDHVTVALDKRLLFMAWDRGLLKDGRIALWTEEDTVARFDQLEIIPHPWQEHD